MRIGFLVNPIAGMGGSVGLKGTDGEDVLRQALALGANPIAMDRAAAALDVVAEAAGQADWSAAGGEMGADLLRYLGLEPAVVERHASTSSAATRSTVQTMVETGVDLILFAGGDGTARDITSVVGLNVPLLGIPSGVKMHSSVFATTPRAAGRLISDMLAGSGARVGYRKVEIMDIDEDDLRAGRLTARLYGYARAPHVRTLLQNAKATPPLADEALMVALGHDVAQDFQPGVNYLIGPGTTAKRPLDALGLSGTLLGVDILKDGVLVARDVGEAQALALVDGEPMHIVVGVTGGQGFVFGRGNQQIGPEAIRRCWPNDVTILASAEKLSALPRPELLADTGDPALDTAVSGYVRVRTAPRRSVMMRIV